MLNWSGLLVDERPVKFPDRAGWRLTALRLAGGRCRGLIQTLGGAPSMGNRITGISAFRYRYQMS